MEINRVLVIKVKINRFDGVRKQHASRFGKEEKSGNQRLLRNTSGRHTQPEQRFTSVTVECCRCRGTFRYGPFRIANMQKTSPVGTVDVASILLECGKQG